MNAEIKQRIDQLRWGEIPKGYQKTEFGIFPCDWVTDKKLKDLGTFGKGKGLPGDKIRSEGVPCVGYGDIYMKYNHFHFEKAQSFVDQETVAESQPIQKGTLLFTGTGETADEIGKCVCYNGDETIYAGGDIITFVSDEVEPLFLAYQQYQSFSLRRKASFGQGHSVVHIQCENLGELPLAYPADRIEQRKIVEILLKWDKTIELQEQLIKELKIYKTICLEKMFPAKGKDVPEWRFKGFFVPWVQRKLGEIVTMQKGQQLGKVEMSVRGTYYVLNGGTEPSGFSERYNTPANTISISEGGNSCGYVALNLERFWSGGHNYTLKNPQIETLYLYQWLKRQEKIIMAMRVGSGLPNIQKSLLQDLVVLYPNEYEQRMIATILMCLDELIALHQKKRKTLQKQRKVLQLYLLNGIVRVI